MKKIALLTSGIYPFQIGGIQKHSYYLAKYFARHKIYVDLYTTLTNNRDQTEGFFSLEELNYLNFIEIEFPLVKKIPGHYIYASYLFSKNLYNFLSTKEYDSIYAQGLTSWCFLKKKPFQKNIISNLHGLEMFQTKINFRNRIEHILLKIPAKKIIKNSFKQVSLGGKLTGILYKNGAKENSILEIPNGIDASWVQDETTITCNNSSEKLKFIFIGRYERRKGIEEFQVVIIRTIDQLNYQVEFVGPIPMGKQLKNKNVYYSGMIRESAIIKEKLMQADILICPSYSEGMPTVILEAMACGCAIITTDVGANATMVSEENGWLIRGDIRKGLEKSINEAILLSQQELLKMKLNSINKVKDKFTWDKIIQSTIKEIEEC